MNNTRNSPGATGEGVRPSVYKYPNGFTPGPWKITPDQIQGIGPTLEVTSTSEDRGSASWIAQVLNDGFEDGQANARLIAAAPDMFEALEVSPILSKYHGQHGFELERFIYDYVLWTCKQVAALARARGEQ